jgi:solute:Na+ symporter, SSS family
MRLLDWIVLLGTVFFIVVYGLWKSKKNQTIADYLKSGHSLTWFTISLSIISTQASAITFLSTPGQAYTDGMRFILFYLGLPIAMVVTSIILIPIYYRLNVMTAYELLEKRFDVKTRVLTAFFFLIQRGLAAGISIAAPSLVLSVILEWNFYWINILVGSVVIFYTVRGGSDAISQTQKLQMLVILVGMAIAGYLVVKLMPQDVSLMDAMRVAGKADKFNTMNFEFHWEDKYNFWSGIIGGFFLQLAYFGTDQSQVGRYLGGKSMAQSRLGLLFNGIFKIPMQFGILFIGAMLFVFYHFTMPPVFFNRAEVHKIKQSPYAQQFEKVEKEHQILFENRKQKAVDLIEAMKGDNQKQITQAENAYQQSHENFKAVKQKAVDVLKKYDPEINDKDANYIFLSFVMEYLPAGLVGLLIAVILFAAMSTIASELNALATASVIDIYQRTLRPNQTEKHYLKVSGWMIIAWGLFAIGIAHLSIHLGTLIEVVNWLGSWFYGTILGIFLLALFTKQVKANAVFVAAIISEIVVISLDLSPIPVAYLWFNMIGCILTMVLAVTLSWGMRR